MNYNSDDKGDNFDGWDDDDDLLTFDDEDNNTGDNNNISKDNSQDVAVLVLPASSQPNSTAVGTCTTRTGTTTTGLYSSPSAEAVTVAMPSGKNTTGTSSIQDNTDHDGWDYDDDDDIILGVNDNDNDNDNIEQTSDKNDKQNNDRVDTNETSPNSMDVNASLIVTKSSVSTPIISSRTSTPVTSNKVVVRTGKDSNSSNTNNTNVIVTPPIILAPLPLAVPANSSKLTNATTMSGLTDCIDQDDLEYTVSSGWDDELDPCTDELMLNQDYTTTITTPIATPSKTDDSKQYRPFPSKIQSQQETFGIVTKTIITTPMAENMKPTTTKKLIIPSSFSSKNNTAIPVKKLSTTPIKTALPSSVTKATLPIPTSSATTKEYDDDQDGKDADNLSGWDDLDDNDLFIDDDFEEKKPIDTYSNNMDDTNNSNTIKMMNEIESYILNLNHIYDSLNSLLDAEYNTIEKAIEMQQYYIERPELTKYTIHKELDRMDYTIRTVSTDITEDDNNDDQDNDAYSYENEHQPIVPCIVTDKTEIANLFEKHVDPNTKTTKSKISPTSSSFLCSRCANQSLLADLVQAITGPDRLVRTQYYASISATKCHFKVDLLQALVGVQATLDLSLPTTTKKSGWNIATIHVEIMFSCPGDGGYNDDDNDIDDTMQRQPFVQFKLKQFQSNVDRTTIHQDIKDVVHILNELNQNDNSFDNEHRNYDDNDGGGNVNFDSRNNVYTNFRDAFIHRQTTMMYYNNIMKQVGTNVVSGMKSVWNEIDSSGAGSAAIGKRLVTNLLPSDDIFSQVEALEQEEAQLRIHQLQQQQQQQQQQLLNRQHPVLPHHVAAVTKTTSTSTIPMVTTGNYGSRSSTTVAPSQQQQQQQQQRPTSILGGLVRSIAKSVALPEEDPTLYQEWHQHPPQPHHQQTSFASSTTNMTSRPSPNMSGGSSAGSGFVIPKLYRKDDETVPQTTGSTLPTIKTTHSVAVTSTQVLVQEQSESGSVLKSNMFKKDSRGDRIVQDGWDDFDDGDDIDDEDGMLALRTSNKNNNDNEVKLDQRHSDGVGLQQYPGGSRIVPCSNLRTNPMVATKLGQNATSALDGAILSTTVSESSSIVGTDDITILQTKSTTKSVIATESTTTSSSPPRTAMLGSNYQTVVTTESVTSNNGHHSTNPTKMDGNKNSHEYLTSTVRMEDWVYDPVTGIIPTRKRWVNPRPGNRILI